MDEVIEHLRCKKPVWRFWVSAQDATSIRRGLAALGDNRDYAGFRDAAVARGRAGWLIGMNFSRAYTLRARRGERGTQVQYWKFTEERPKLGAQGQPALDAEGNPEKETVRPECLKMFSATVFNAEQMRPVFSCYNAQLFKARPKTSFS